MSHPSTWVPVALSSAIEPGTSTGVTIDGSEVVIWRDTAGAIHAWEDRCPHRGMRMSFGFVRGDHIACLYHGWQYNSGGQCQYIPAHPDLDVPKTIKVPVYAVTEQAGIVWTLLAAEAPDLSPLPTVEDVMPVRSLYVDCPVDRVITVLKSAALPALDPEADVTTFSALSDSVFSLASGTDRLLVALQTVSAAKTALHIVVGGEATTAAQKHFARWATGLRLKLEAAPAAIAEYA